ncbi:MAG: hypothetical protein K5663_08190 [Clostridiales bacterium]|nr:hypothetical protein [Clostridiales bacterium]
MDGTGSGKVKIACVGLVGQSLFMTVPAFHAAEETLTALSMFDEPGGKGFNQAVAAARAGADVSFLGAVGSEGYDLSAAAFCEHEGIKCCLAKKPGRSACAVIMTDLKGGSRVTVFRGAELDRGDAERFAPEIASADLLLLNSEVPDEVNIACAQAAHACGVKTIMNPAPRRSVPDILKKLVDLFTPNEYEAAELEGMNNCVVTLGSRGCLLKQEGAFIPAEPAVTVDATGAGDTFTGVLAVMLAEGETLYEAAVTANAAAAVTVSRKGAASAIPYRQEYCKK